MFSGPFALPLWTFWIKSNAFKVFWVWRKQIKFSFLKELIKQIQQQNKFWFHQKFKNNGLTFSLAKLTLISLNLICFELLNVQLICWVIIEHHAKNGLTYGRQDEQEWQNHSRKSLHGALTKLESTPEIVDEDDLKINKWTFTLLRIQRSLLILSAFLCNFFYLASTMRPTQLKSYLKSEIQSVLSNK